MHEASEWLHAGDDKHGPPQHHSMAALRMQERNGQHGKQAGCTCICSFGSAARAQLLQCQCSWQWWFYLLPLVQLLLPATARSRVKMLLTRQRHKTCNVPCSLHSTPIMHGLHARWACALLGRNAQGQGLHGAIWHACPPKPEKAQPRGKVPKRINVEGREMKAGMQVHQLSTCMWRRPYGRCFNQGNVCDVP